MREIDRGGDLKLFRLFQLFRPPGLWAMRVVVVNAAAEPSLQNIEISKVLPPGAAQATRLARNVAHFLARQRKSQADTK